MRFADLSAEQECDQDGYKSRKSAADKVYGVITQTSGALDGRAQDAVQQHAGKSREGCQPEPAGQQQVNPLAERSNHPADQQCRHAAGKTDGPVPAAIYPFQVRYQVGFSL